ncbi:hypothetical protein LLG07_00960, partial [bacterium]|nr:hypothetical protein [bacterium]
YTTPFFNFLSSVKLIFVICHRGYNKAYFLLAHSGFNVFCSDRIYPGSSKSLENLAGYYKGIIFTGEVKLYKRSI